MAFANGRGPFDPPELAAEAHVTATLERHALVPPADLLKRRQHHELTRQIRELRSRQAECVEQGYEEPVGLVESAIESLETARRWFGR